MPARQYNYAAAEMPPRLYGSSVAVISDGQWNGLPGMTQLQDGSLIAMYATDATSALSAGVWKYKTSTDAGATWSSASTLYTPSGGDQAHDIDVAVRADGKLIAIGMLEGGASEDIAVFIGTKSGSISWTGPTRITHLSGGTIFSVSVYGTGKPLLLANGTWMLPIYGNVPSDSLNSVGVTFSTDNGVTWANPVIVKRTDGTEQWNEACAVQLGTGRIVMMIRHDMGTRGYARSISDDNGATWSTPANVIVPSGLVDDHSVGRPSLILMRQNWLLFVSRVPTGSRTAWCYSADQGVTWSVLTGLAVAGATAHWYASGIALADGNIGVLVAYGNGTASDMLYQTFQQLH